MCQVADSPYETPLTVREAAERAGVHINTIYNWIYRGLLTAYKTRTGKYRIKPGDLDAALYSQPFTATEEQ